MGPGNRPGHGELPEDEVFILVAAVKVNSVAFLEDLFKITLQPLFKPKSLTFLTLM
jgi:hypothetical protein